MTAKKAQGTIEYLVIIAIVVVIALVVVGLLLQVMQQGNAVPETSAKAAWKSAQPWGITDWTRSANVLTVVLQNNSADTMSTENFQATADDINTNAIFPGFINVAPGAKVTYYVTVDSASCTTGSKYAIPKAGIKIDYNTTEIGDKSQYGVADIIGTC